MSIFNYFQNSIEMLANTYRKEEDVMAEIYLHVSQFFFDNSDLVQSKMYLDKANQQIKTAWNKPNSNFSRLQELFMISSINQVILNLKMYDETKDDKESIEHIERIMTELHQKGYKIKGECFSTTQLLKKIIAVKSNISKEAMEGLVQKKNDSRNRNEDLNTAFSNGCIRLYYYCLNQDYDMIHEISEKLEEDIQKNNIKRENQLWYLSFQAFLYLMNKNYDDSIAIYSDILNKYSQTLYEKVIANLNKSICLFMKLESDEAFKNLQGISKDVLERYMGSNYNLHKYELKLLLRFKQFLYSNSYISEQLNDNERAILEKLNLEAI